MRLQTEAVARRCSAKKVFLKVLQNSQENACVGVSFLIKFRRPETPTQFSCEFCEIFIKGYLRYKTITSQNVPSRAQIKNVFISQKNYVPFSRYSSFCIFNRLMIYQISDVTMSISTYEIRCIFEYIF